MSAEVVISGATGRMGRTLLALAANAADVTTAGALEASGHAAVGADSGIEAGTGANGVLVRTTPARS